MASRGGGVTIRDIVWTMPATWKANRLKYRKELPWPCSRETPYKGIQPALNDLAGGHIALMSAPIPVALPLVQGARVRMLGVTTKERLEAIPDVPPLAEIGVPGYNAPSWFMLVAPARTPRAIIEKLHGDLRAVLDEADVREEFIMRQGLIPVRSPPPDELKRFVATEIVRFGDIVRKTGLAGSE
jgi:tripartite-type tricarboxylate transporter receptor subunit TctC